MSIPADELASLQADMASAMLDKTCNVYRPSITKDAYSNTVLTYPGSPTHSAVPCGMELPSGSFLQLLGEKETAVNTWVFYVAVGSDIQINDKVVIGSRSLIIDSDLTLESLPLLAHFFAVSTA